VKKILLPLVTGIIGGVLFIWLALPLFETKPTAPVPAPMHEFQGEIDGKPFKGTWK